MDLDDEELAATRVMHGLDKIDGSDINVGSIEEDIKILEKFLKEMDDFFQQAKINNTKERKALANLLENYQKQKQESKKYEQMYLDEVDKHVGVVLLYNKLLKENRENKKKYLSLLLGQFPDNTGTYKKYKKELDELLQQEETDE